MKIEGVGKTGWKEGEDIKKSEGKGKTNTYFEGSEEYLSTTTYLIGGEEGSVQINIKICLSIISSIPILK